MDMRAFYRSFGRANYRLSYCTQNSTLRRFNSTNAEHIQWVERFRPTDIPRHQFDLIFSRSSGAGGQNVNKVNTRATIKLSKEVWNQVCWLPLAVKQQLVPGRFPYITKSGGILVTSERTRSRQANLDDCFEKLCKGIKDSVVFFADPSDEAVSRWAKIHKVQDEKRLAAKKFQQSKKEFRRQRGSIDS
jgi:peptidyl-tRNA hydrolase ICT1